MTEKKYQAEFDKYLENLQSMPFFDEIDKKRLEYHFFLALLAAQKIVPFFPSYGKIEKSDMVEFASPAENYDDQNAMDAINQAAIRFHNELLTNQIANVLYLRTEDDILKIVSETQKQELEHIASQVNLDQ